MDYGKGMMIARTKAGMSKRQLAKMVGVDASFITHIEAGRKRPSLDTMEKAAQVLGMPTLVLILKIAKALEVSSGELLYCTEALLPEGYLAAQL